MKILIEAVGSYTSGYLIDAIQAAGHHCVASDITPNSAGAILADSFILFPKKFDNELWQTIEDLLVCHKVDVVIPTFDEMLQGWAKRKEYFLTLGIYIIISPLETLLPFGDKWQTYLAFNLMGLPTPKTSLFADYTVLKPREGRGAVGISFLTKEELLTVNMPNGYISQEEVKGDEYTVDCLFDCHGVLIYCVPRKRLAVKEGKSTAGEVDCQESIIEAINLLADNFLFHGAINVQCFVNNSGIQFIEINARFGGGSSLGMAATENWIPLLINSFVDSKPVIGTQLIKNKLRMYRQYRDVFDEP